MKTFASVVAAFALVLSTGCRAFASDEIDPTTLWELTTEGSSRTVKAGDKGKVVIEIRGKNGAHVSDEAPLKLELKGTEVTPEKQKLTLADSVGTRREGQKYPDPRFEVTFATQAPAKAAVDAKVTFFICTDTLCTRQQKTVSIPVEVTGAGS